MALTIENRLIEVRDAPTKRNVKVEEFRKLLCCLSRIGVAPSTERNEDLVVCTKRHIPVHHGADANGGETGDLYTILFFDVFAQGGIAVLKTFPDGLDAIGPQTIDELVLPGVTALCDGLVVFVNQHSLDTCGSEFNAQHGTTGFYD